VSNREDGGVIVGDLHSDVLAQALGRAPLGGDAYVK